MSEILIPCPSCGGEADSAQKYQHGHFIDNYGTKQEAIDALKRRMNNEGETY